MGLFDIFTGGSAKNAAAQNAALYQQYGNQATSALNQGLGSATGALNTGLTRSTDALTSGANRGYDILGQGLQGQLGALGQGQEQAAGAYGQALGAYTPLSSLGSKYGGATNLLLGSLGANGPQGTQAAQAAFQAGPGYQWNVNQQLDALNRAGVARGQAIGNTSADVMARAQGLANQEYGNWQNQLGSFVNPELQATSGAAQGQSGIYGNLANLYSQGGAARAGAIGNTAGAQGGMQNQLGQNLAGAYGSTGNALAGAYTGQGQNLSNVYGNVASGQANSNTAAANAEMQGSSQFWNGLLGAAGNVVKAGTGGTGWFGGGSPTPTQSGFNMFKPTTWVG